MNIYAVQARLSKIRYAIAIWILLVLLCDLLLGLVSVIWHGGNSWVAYGAIVGAAFLTLLIPYIFGEKRVKVMALAGLLTITIAGAATGAATLSYIYEGWVAPYEDPAGPVHNVTLTPYMNVEGGAYTFTAQYEGAEPPGSLNLTLYDFSKPFWARTDPIVLSVNRSNDSALYSITYSPPPGLYRHSFAAGGIPYTEAWGPINSPYVDNLPLFMMLGVTQFLISIWFLFAIGLLLYWWLRKGQMMRREWADAKRTARTFKCSACGAMVDADASFCPKCGERFEER
ncbi:MAG: zinc ribbon domain-containing protein [Candidatus Thermoplasmatota archaeon]